MDNRLSAKTLITRDFITSMHRIMPIILKKHGFNIDEYEETEEKEETEEETTETEEENAHEHEHEHEANTETQPTEEVTTPEASNPEVAQ